MPCFVVHGQKLDYIDTYKYLGYTLDPFLNFDFMMQILVRTVTYKIYLLAKMCPMFTLNAAFAE